MNKREISKIMAQAGKFPAKVELASEKVELANAKDVGKYIKRIIGVEKKLDKNLPILEKLNKDVKDQKAELNIYVEEAERFLNELDKQVKDLGIDASAIPDYKTLVTEISNAKIAYK